MGVDEQQFELRDDLIDRILTWPEGIEIEFKRVENVHSIIKTACAMANTEGGLIFVGIADCRQYDGRDRIRGIEANEEAFGNIQYDLSHQLTPPLQLPECTPPYTFTNFLYVTQWPTRTDYLCRSQEKQCGSFDRKWWNVYSLW